MTWKMVTILLFIVFVVFLAYFVLLSTIFVLWNLAVSLYRRLTGGKKKSRIIAPT